MSAGFDVVGAFDNWVAAHDAYALNVADHVDVVDLGCWEDAAERVSALAPDVVVGSPPCQDFSHAGPRSEGHNASLTVAFGRIVAAVGPTAFLMENVPRTARSVAYSEMWGILRSQGYVSFEKVLSADLYGVPQKRRRLFVFGVRSQMSDALVTWSSELDRLASSESMSVREFMGDEIDFEHFSVHPRNYKRRAVFSVDGPAPTVRGVNRPGNCPGYPGHHLDSAPMSEAHSLTTRERARLQSFPAWFEWPGQNRNAVAEKLIGNAVPPLLARAVGVAALKALLP